MKFKILKFGLLFLFLIISSSTITKSAPETRNFEDVSFTIDNARLAINNRNMDIMFKGHTIPIQVKYLEDKSIETIFGTKHKFSFDFTNNLAVNIPSVQFSLVFDVFPKELTEIDHNLCIDGVCEYKDYIDRENVINFNEELDFDYSDLINLGLNMDSYEFKDNKLYLNFNGNIEIKSGEMLELDPVFTSDAVEGLSIAPINNTAFVIVWCDESGNDITFEVRATDGTLLRDDTDVDTAVTSCPRWNTVSVDIFNETDIVIGYGDASSADASYITGNWETLSTVNYNSIGDIDTDVGAGGGAISVSTLDSERYLIAWSDGATDTEVVRAQVVYQNGSLIDSAQVIESGDIGVAPQSVSTTNFNSTDFVVAYTFAPDAKYTLGRIENNVVSLILEQNTVFDGSIRQIVSVDALNETAFVYLWYNYVGFGDDVYYEIHNFTGNRTSSDNINIDSNVGSGDDMPVAVTSLNDTHFALIYGDSASTDAYFAVYGTDEIALVSPYSIEGVSYSYVAINSQKQSLGIGFCNEGIVSATSSEKYFVNVSDGSYWDGTCPSVGDTCTYGGSGHYNIKGSDYCKLTASENLAGSDFNCIDAGLILIDDSVLINEVGNVMLADGCTLAFGDKATLSVQ